MGGDPRALEPSALEWRDLLPSQSGAFSINPLAAAAGTGLPWWDTSVAHGDVEASTS
jgi:hypothetical protein